MSVALAPTGFTHYSCTDSQRPTKCLFAGERHQVANKKWQKSFYNVCMLLALLFCHLNIKKLGKFWELFHLIEIWNGDVTSELRCDLSLRCMFYAWFSIFGRHLAYFTILTCNFNIFKHISSFLTSISRRKLLEIIRTSKIIIARRNWAAR